LQKFAPTEKNSYTGAPFTDVCKMQDLALKIWGLFGQECGPTFLNMGYHIKLLQTSTEEEKPLINLSASFKNYVNGLSEQTISK
jgi:hypothetical protein